jgi:hypothetical protein
MADITKTVALRRFQLSTPTSPSPRLAAPISATDTTIITTAAPLDRSGAVINGGFIAGIKSNGYTEGVKVTAVSADGLTWTVVRGLYLEGLDKTTSNAALAVAHDADSQISCSVDSIHWDMALSFIRGEIASGANEIKVGNQDNGNIKFVFDDGTVTPPYIIMKPGVGMFYADDGVTENPMGGAGSLTAGTGIDITAGVLSVDFADTSAFVASSAGAADAGKGVKLDAAGLVPTETVELVKNLTATASEVNQVCDGVGASVQASNLTTLCFGSTSNADALHTHLSIGNFKFGVFSYDVSTASGSTNIAHGLGKIPKMITFDIVGSENSGHSFMSHGASDGTNNNCAYRDGSSSHLSQIATDKCIMASASTSTTICTYATATMDATNITLAWIKNGSPTGNIAVRWIAQ